MDQFVAISDKKNCEHFCCHIIVRIMIIISFRKRQAEEAKEIEDSSMYNRASNITT